VSLNDWEKNGWLKRHSTSREEIQNLLKIIERDLQDCQVRHVSADWRFAIAYNAALQCCRIALYCAGFQPQRGQSEHYRVIQSLSLTLGVDFEEMSSYLNSCRSKRNISDYDSMGTISDSEVDELIKNVQELQTDLLRWLKKNYRKYI